jgi:acetyl-CoA synthetase
VGDVSTLANPQIVDGIKHHIQREKLGHYAVPRQLSPEETAEILGFGNQE